MSNQQFMDLWEKAVAQFEDTTGKNLHDKSFRKPVSVEDLVNAIEAEHSKFSAYRERGATLRRYIQIMLAPIIILDSLVACGVSTVRSSLIHKSDVLLLIHTKVFPPSQLIFGAVFFLVKVRP